MNAEPKVTTVPLSNGGFAVVDADSFESLSKYIWRKHPNGYACRGTRKCGKYSLILMHREINQTPVGMCTDHINGDKLDNRRSNLRNANYSQNATYARKTKRRTSSRYRGVCFRKDRGTWLASIRIEGTNRKIGTFESELEAAIAYNSEAIRLHGDFASINMPR